MFFCGASECTLSTDGSEDGRSRSGSEDWSSEAHAEEQRVLSREDCGRIADAFSQGFTGKEYDEMADDRQRVEQYTRAIRKAVPGKVVLDIGTGRDALLAIICARAGAKRVVAVEVVPTAAANARKAVADAGLEGIIEVHEGHSSLAALPRVDMTVHEIVGGLAPEEGMGLALLDLQSRPEVVDALRPGWSLPRRVETRMAPLAHGAPGTVTGMAVRQWAVSGPLEVDRLMRLPVAPPPEFLLGELQMLDVLDAEADLQPQLEQDRTLRWRFDKPAVLTGFACAPWLDLDGQHVVDAWLGGTSWRHKLVGLKSPVRVRAGDEVALTLHAEFDKFPTRYGFSAEYLFQGQQVSRRPQASSSQRSLPGVVPQPPLLLGASSSQRSLPGVLPGVQSFRAH